MVSFFWRRGGGHCNIIQKMLSCWAEYPKRNGKLWGCRDLIAKYLPNLIGAINNIFMQMKLVSDLEESIFLMWLHGFDGSFAGVIFGSSYMISTWKGETCLRIRTKEADAGLLTAPKSPAPQKLSLSLVVFQGGAPWQKGTAKRVITDWECFRSGSFLIQLSQ